MMTGTAAPDEVGSIFSENQSRAIISEIVRLILEEDRRYVVGRINEDAQRLLPATLSFLNENSDKTPEELAAIARAIGFGGAHNGGRIVRYVREHVLFACPRLVAACLYAEWQGGKAGFQFLPDPATTDPIEYDDLVWDLMESLENGAPDPRLVLMNGYSNDLAFYESLPDSFTVYRGAGGISAQSAAAGVCWTTSRDWAEWFAARLSGDPVVVSARIRKSDVRLAFSNEHEVVVAPRKFRALKPRGSPSKRPSGWGPEQTKEELAAVTEQYDAYDLNFHASLSPTHREEGIELVARLSKLQFQGEP